jgi:hypothetical protein
VPRAEMRVRGDAGETAQRGGSSFVGLVARDRGSGVLRALSERRLGEQFDEGGGDFIGRGLDRKANAGPELDDAPGVELLVASPAGAVVCRGRGRGGLCPARRG